MGVLGFGDTSVFDSVSEQSRMFSQNVHTHKGYSFKNIQLNTIQAVIGYLGNKAKSESTMFWKLSSKTYLHGIASDDHHIHTTHCTALRVERCQREREGLGTTLETQPCIVAGSPGSIG